MALTSGTRLGPYEILSAIGAGGMGEVYRARDTKLDRDVAIKVLPDAFAADSERIARFQREAKTLAALNHPHIAAIYGIEESSGTYALVMELVEGEDLSQRIARGAIPLDEALPIAKQIAEALEAAHEQGIIHRDLKPANIKVTPDGVVKVLDFGLAKLADHDHGRQPAAGGAHLSLSPTITSPAMMTGVGILLGTAAYMSPEQAKGREADKRSDVWAFGCVLYEMLTGKRPFDGEDVTDVMVAVLSKEPDWSKLPASVPSSIRTLLRRCLERDRRKRVADIAAALFAIDEHASLRGSAAAEPTTEPRRRIVAAASVALLVGAAGATIATWALTRPAPATLQSMRFAIVPPPAQRLLATGNIRSVDISPDGTHVVYFASTTTGQSQLMVRAIDQLDAAPLHGLVGFGPFFSPDGRWVGFFTGTELKKVSISGGAPITICRASNPRGASWGPDNTIVFATNDTNTGLLSVPAAGGEPRVLTKPDRAQGEFDDVFPSVLPGGRALLFTISPTGPIDNAQVAVLDLTTGQRKILIRGGSSAVYVDTGHLVYAVGGTLRAVRFDLTRLEVMGDPVPVVEQVSTLSTGAAEFDVSRNGALVYVPGSAGTGQYGTQRSLVWVTRQGREEPINLPPRTYTYPRISPDGTRVALDIRDQENDLWIWDLARQVLTRLTFDPGTDFYPVWTSDSRRIVFQSSRAGRGGYMFWQAANGTGTVEQLTMSSTTPHYPYSMSPDGKSLVFQENSPKTGVDLSLLTLDSKPHSQLLIQTTFAETNAEISPDGHWLAYQSNESGQEEVYVRPFPKVDDGRWQISTGGGTRPLWARSGRELFYLDAGGLLTTAAVQTTPTFSAAQPVRLLNTRYFGGFGGGGQTVAGRTYDVSPDGQRFLMIKDVAAGDQNTTPASIVVVLNWFEELKRLVPTK